MGRRSDIKPLPSVERLDELLSYDETSGLLTWKMLVATSRSNICHNNKCAISGLKMPQKFAAMQPKDCTVNLRA